MSMWMVMIAVGAGSFAFRLGPQLLFEHATMSARTDRVIRHAGIAAITALIVVSTKQAATGRATVPALLAVATAAVLGARGGSILRLLGMGGAVYLVATLAVDLVTR
jgi:branched-subunit amino acid transport protein